MSTTHFNQLNPAEAERLAILAEECAEVIKVVGKILRHGYESYDPTGKESGTNRSLLEKELGDIKAINKTMEESGDVSRDLILDAMTDKWRKINIEKKYIHHT